MSTAPALASDAAGLPAMPSVADLSKSPNLALAIWFNDALFDRVKTIATYISRADGFTPGHLVGKPEACFAVVTRALTWRLDPFAVAQCTYQPAPGAKVGYEGKLVQAILENSGHLDGGVSFEHFGEWSKIAGKFEKRKSDKGKEYAVPAWNPKDEEGLGVIVRAKIKGEEKPREFEFFLNQAFPRNSVSWATDPKTQICYLAVRRFANVRCPGLLMGVPFDREDEAPSTVDVTPTPARPTRDQFTETATVVAEAVQVFTFTDSDGECRDCEAEAFVDELVGALRNAGSEREIEGLWESNSALLPDIREIGPDLAQAAHDAYSEALDRVHVNGGSKVQTTSATILEVPLKGSGVKDYAAFCRILADRLKEASDVDTFNAWQTLNEREMAEAEKATPNAYASLQAVIDAKGNELLGGEG